METKKKKNIWLVILFILFIIYMGLYVALRTGYYETSVNNKTLFTEESISQFENDLKDGKYIDINSYVKETHNYNNKISSLCLAFTRTIESVATSIFNDIYKLMEYLVGT